MGGIFFKAFKEAFKAVFKEYRNTGPYKDLGLRKYLIFKELRAHIYFAIKLIMAKRQ